ncbi:MAG: aldo/keto reductase [Planctomycetaceae bacterium]|jgi:D-xylose reductase|nr:aldo/keto reductase [Planctomycetaceae bacterium]MDG2389034.1 aldo/keto reductase [Planctomycetaceae bacterium]
MTTFKLNTGDELPSVGLGMWKVDPDIIPNLVQEAVKAGYRHFDNACDYGNELQVGEGLQAAYDAGLCQREDLWLTSKLWNTFHKPEDVREGCVKSLLDLQTDYLDLYLIHFPIALEYVPIETRYPPGWFLDPDATDPKMHPINVPIRETWEAMQELVKDGLVKNIGVCNFNVSLIRDLLSYAEIPPAVLQVELHPHLTQEKLLRFCQEQGIAVTGFSPFGASSYVPIGMATEAESLLGDATIAEIAKNHDRSPAQILLRWGIQRGTAVIPKTSKVERLAENLSLFDFELSTDDMNTINDLNRHRRYNDPGDFCEAAFNTFFPIYE